MQIGNQGKLVIDKKSYLIEAPLIMRYTSSYHVISHKLNLSICSPDLLLFINFGQSDKLDLGLLATGHVFPVGKNVNACRLDFMDLKEDFDGVAVSGQLEILENDQSENLLCINLIDIVILGGDNRERRIDGKVSIVYERMGEKLIKKNS